MKSISLTAAVAAMLFFPVLSPAAEGRPGAEREARFEAWCKANPEKCREVQALREQCRADPGKCRAARETRRAECKANPERCRAEQQARREQWCKANPGRCQEMQARAEQCKADPAKCEAERAARIQERFRKADVNNDGRLTREEAQRGMPRIARHFDEIDVNKDGAVTPQELQAARKARGGPHPGRPGGARGHGATDRSA